MASTTLTGTVLGKRKTSKDLVLHLTSDTEFEQGSSTKTKSASAPVLVNGNLVQNTKYIYKCTYDGCERAYSKPSRLEEHERSHTGEVAVSFLNRRPLIHFIFSQRPFSCSTCNKSYLRETHLQAHLRSHLPESDRPLVCPDPKCEKRFWTSQHLRVHTDWHNGAKPLTVSRDSDCFFGYISYTGSSVPSLVVTKHLQNIISYALTSAMHTPLLAQSLTDVHMKGAQNHLLPTSIYARTQRYTTVRLMQLIWSMSDIPKRESLHLRSTDVFGCLRPDTHVLCNMDCTSAPPAQCSSPHVFSSVMQRAYICIAKGPPRPSKTSRRAGNRERNGCRAKWF